MSENTDTKPDSGSLRCYALIPYRAPSIFTSSELATLRHGTFGEWNRVMFFATVRMLGVPKHVMLADADGNYSSAKREHHG